MKHPLLTIGTLLLAASSLAHAQAQPEDLSCATVQEQTRALLAVPVSGIPFSDAGVAVLKIARPYFEATSCSLWRPNEQSAPFSLDCVSSMPAPEAIYFVSKLQKQLQSCSFGAFDQTQSQRAEQSVVLWSAPTPSDWNTSARVAIKLTYLKNQPATVAFQIYKASPTPEPQSFERLNTVR